MANSEFIPTIIVLTGLICVLLAWLIQRYLKNLYKKKKHTKPFLLKLCMALGVFGLFGLWASNVIKGISLASIAQLSIVIGSSLNLIVMWSNGGFMPVHELGTVELQRSLLSIEKQIRSKRYKFSHTKFLEVESAINRVKSQMDRQITYCHRTLTPYTKLKILADWIPVGVSKVSIGDVLITGAVPFFLFGILLEIWN